MYVVYYCCCLATMPRAGLVDSVCCVLLLLSGDHASCGSCRQCMLCTTVAVWRPCLVRVLSTVYVVYYCYCPAIMPRAGLVNIVCCNCVLLLLSGDHASCGSCRQCICCVLLLLSGDHASCRYYYNSLTCFVDNIIDCLVMYHTFGSS